MIVVSLDEGGIFEKNPKKPNEGCMLIGGCVFQCSDKNAAKKEEDRLEKWFRCICEENDAEYPYDLHYNHDSTGRTLNSENATRVKNALMKELHLFLHGCERWGYPERKYTLYCMVGDRYGMDTAAPAPYSNLANDNTAAMRYEHMVYRTIENLLFYNPHLENEKEMRLDLATRVMNVKDDYDRQLEAKELGYDRRRVDAVTFDDTSRIVTDASSFRTALSYALQNSARDDIKFDLNVLSISYKKDLRSHLFLYLADTLCTFYQNATRTAQTAAEALSMLKEAFAGKPGIRTGYLWTYSTHDKSCRRIFDNARHGNEFDAVKEICEKRVNGDSIDAVYDSIWYKPLLTKLEGSADALTLRDCLARLNDYLHRDECNLTVAEGILDILTRKHAKLKTGSVSDELQFELNKSRITLYNHKGDYEAAMKEMDTCMASASHVTVEEFIGLTYLMCVALLDAGRTNEAITYAEKAVSYHQLLAEIKEEIFSDKKDINVSNGRALSQLGQCCAFARRYGEAEAHLKDAIKCFGSSASEISKTRSYLLHLYIEAGEREKYMETAVEFFGAQNLMRQWDNIQIMDSTARKFALYVYMKALYTFFTNDIKNADLRKLLDAVSELGISAADGHPWQLIYKYCALLEIKRFAPLGDAFSAECMTKADEAVANNKDGILPRILAYGKAQVDALIHGAEMPESETLNYTYI